MISPFRGVNPQPEVSCIEEHLPKFAGDPEFNDEGTQRLLNKMLHQRTGFGTATPMQEDFIGASRKPLKKSAGVDGVAPHLLQHLPRELQWDLHLAICEVWKTGDIPDEWLQSRITLMYKKGDPRSALHTTPSQSPQ
mmetsp:Transcript_35959/g.64316  ORF Transcript_35959/g.64316 Transcript_35959/m.64316 type:complete len:137 (-) Transcript_35959:211-621(-)